MSRARAGLVALVAMVALGLLWLAGSGPVQVAPLVDASAGDTSLEPTDRGDLALGAASTVDQDNLEVRVSDGERVDLADRSGRATPPAKHPNPPSVYVRTRLVIAGRPGPYVSVPVRYMNSGRSWLLGTTTTGGLEHTLSRPGKYRFYVDPKKLPEPYVLANRKSRGVFATLPGSSEEVQLSAGERFETELYVLESRRLTGQVVSSAGLPVAGAKVSLYERAAGERKFVDNRTTDRYGQFAFLGLFPTIYELVASPPMVGDGAELGGPLPREFDLTERSLEARRVALGAGVLEVRGRVVDENGAPLVGLFVQLRYLQVPEEAKAPAKASATQDHSVLVEAYGEDLAPRIELAEPLRPRDSKPKVREARPMPLPGGSRVVTNANGEFRILGVQPSRLEIRLGRDGRTVGTRSKPLADSKTLSIDLSETEDVVHDVGEHRLERSNHFELSGRVLMTAVRHEGKRVRLNRLLVRGEYELEGKGRGKLSGKDVQFDRGTGEFTIHCDPELQLLHVLVHPWNRKEFAKEYTFAIEAYGVQRDVELEYP